MIKKPLAWMALLAILGIVTGCASSTIQSPCPDFGKWCTKTPINPLNDLTGVHYG